MKRVKAGNNYFKSPERESNRGESVAVSPTDYKALYEQEVIKNRNQYISLFRDQKTIMIMVDVSTMLIVDANLAAVSFYGYPYEVLTKMYAYQLTILPKEELAKRLRHAIEQEHAPDFGQHRLANNDIRDVEVRNGKINYEGRELLFVIINDITESIKVKKALEKSEEKFRKIFKTSPDAISISRVKDGKFIEINKSFTAITEYTQEEIVGKTSFEASIWADEKDRGYLVKTLKEKGAVKNFATRFRMKSGKIFHGLISANVIDINGVLHILSVARSIEDAVKANEALHQSEIKFRKAFKVSPDAININRMEDGMYVDINKGFTAITGYTPEDVEGKTSIEIDIWADKKDRDYLVKTLKEKGVIRNFAARFKMKSGNIIHGLMSANFIDIDGVPHILSVTRNMEKYIKANEALQQSELKFRKIFRTSPDTITISRLIDGRYIEVNESFTTNTGYSREEAIGKTAFELNLWFDNKDRNKVVEATKGKGSVQNLHVRFRVKNGNILHGLLSTNIIDIEGVPHVLSVIQNIEGSVKAREALQQSELKFRKAFTISPDAIAITHLESGLYVEINEGFTSMTGYTRDDIAGKTAPEIAIWADIKERDKLRLALKKKGSVKDFPSSFRMKNGDIVHAMVSANFIEINGEPHIISIMRDIEDYIKATEAYHQSEQRYKTLFELSPAGVMLIDETGTILEANPTYCKNIGYTAQELIGGKIWKVVNNPLQEKKEFILKYMPTIPRNKIVEKEVVNICKNGELLFLHLYETRIPLENNQMAILSISMDVTREKRIREELDRNTKRLKEAQDIGRLGSWELNWKAKKLYWSDGIYRLLELDTSQVPSYFLFRQRIHPDDLRAAHRVLKDSIKSGTSFKHVHRLLLDDGKIKWVIERGKSFFDNNKKLIRTHGTVQDITRLKETEDKLKELNELLEEKVRDRTAKLKKKQRDLSNLLNDMQMVQQKLRRTNIALQYLNHELEAFSYSVSHDLKAPLRAIHGFTTILKEDYYPILDQEGKTLADDILSEADRMAEIIDALLQLSRTGRKNLNFVEFDLSPLAQSIFMEQQKQYNLPQARLEIHELPSVYADYSLIKQLMTNLLSNALKYSANEPYPLVEVGIGKDKKNNKTFFYVKDNGVGFDEESAGKMFDAFHRLHSRKEFEGTGIGLAIAKRIVTRHGGKIWAKSQRGGGAALFFTLSETDKQEYL